MSLKSDQRQIMEQIADLAQVKGSGTCLISYYIADGTEVGGCSRMITKELGTASNIKSAGTRKAVQSGLKSIQHYLRGLKKIPSGGMAMFAGNQSLV